MDRKRRLTFAFIIVAHFLAIASVRRGMRDRVSRACDAPRVKVYTCEREMLDDAAETLGRHLGAHVCTSCSSYDAFIPMQPYSCKKGSPLSMSVPECGARHSPPVLATVPALTRALSTKSVLCATQGQRCHILPTNASLSGLWMVKRDGTSSGKGIEVVHGEDLVGSEGMAVQLFQNPMMHTTPSGVTVKLDLRMFSCLVPSDNADGFTVWVSRDIVYRSTRADRNFNATSMSPEDHMTNSRVTMGIKGGYLYPPLPFTTWGRIDDLSELLPMRARIMQSFCERMTRFVRHAGGGVLRGRRAFIPMYTDVLLNVWGEVELSDVHAGVAHKPGRDRTLYPQHRQATDFDPELRRTIHRAAWGAILVPLPMLLGLPSASRGWGYSRCV